MQAHVQDAVGVRRYLHELDIFNAQSTLHHPQCGIDAELDILASKLMLSHLIGCVGRFFFDWLSYSYDQVHYDTARREFLQRYVESSLQQLN